MKLPEFDAVFDNGDTVHVQVTSRDLLTLERAGTNLEDIPGIEGMYRMAHIALKRLEKSGKVALHEPVPDSWEALAEGVDIDGLGDDEGGSSGQAPTTG